MILRILTRSRQCSNTRDTLHLCSILLFCFFGFHSLTFLTFSSIWWCFSSTLRFLSSPSFSRSFSVLPVVFFSLFLAYVCLLLLSFSSIRAKHLHLVNTRALEDIGVVVEGGSGLRNSEDWEGDFDEVDVLRLGIVCLADVSDQNSENYLAKEKQNQIMMHGYLNLCVLRSRSGQTGWGC